MFGRRKKDAPAESKDPEKGSLLEKDQFPIHDGVSDENDLVCENVPRAWFLTLVMLGMSIIHFATPLAALGVLFAGEKEMTPMCYKYEDPVMFYACLSTGFCLWTFPVVAALTVVFVYAKNLLDSRLFYRMMGHDVLMQFQSFKQQVFTNKFVAFTICYGCLGLCSFFFHREGSVIGHLMRNVAYLVPIGTFFYLLYSKWSTNAHVISLPSVYENPPEGLGTEWFRGYVARAIFVTEDQLHQAVHTVFPTLANLHNATGAKVTMKQYIGMLLTVALAADKEIHDDYDGDIKLAGVHGWQDWLLGRMYWVIPIVFARFCEDERNERFQRWFVVYMMWMVFVTWIMLVLFVVVAAYYLHINKVPWDQNPFLFFLKFLLVPGSTANLVRTMP
mmetsp:Transcript_21273/g.51458  ORF Transcript_21273/g.51458 Transcript_21273/m.51458 type:complete len:389 (+) Transcript_21273:98-1264(+)